MGRYRQGLSRQELWRRRVSAGAPVPGMMEVPATALVPRSDRRIRQMELLVAFAGGLAGALPALGLMIGVHPFCAPSHASG